MNRMKFEEPELAVSCFAVEDVVTTSTTLTDGGAGDTPTTLVFGRLFG